MSTRKAVRAMGWAALLAALVGAGALLGCLPEGWEQHAKNWLPPPPPPKQAPPAAVPYRADTTKIATPPGTVVVQPMQVAKFTPPQFSAKAQTPPSKAPAGSLGPAVPAPQVRGIYAVKAKDVVYNDGVAGWKGGKEYDRFVFCVDFTQDIDLASLNTFGATQIIATCPGKNPPGPRPFPLSGLFLQAGPKVNPGGYTLRRVEFRSSQFASDLVQAAGWTTGHEIVMARQSFTVQVTLFGTPPARGGPVVRGVSGLALDGDRDGRPGGVFTRAISHAGMFTPVPVP